MPGGGRQRRAAALPFSRFPSLPHSPSSTAATVLSSSQFFLRKPGQLHPFLPAFAIAAEGPGVRRAEGRCLLARSPARLPPCAPRRCALSEGRRSRGAHLATKKPGPSPAPSLPSSSARPLPSRPAPRSPPCCPLGLHPPPGGLGCGEGWGLPCDTLPSLSGLGEMRKGQGEE